ncbi:MAG: 50S ribosome-binding GTPase [Actinobacteria bacterium]|nr:50S ribosome-binding GTPase [Actinomycetota bacterium]
MSRRSPRLEDRLAALDRARSLGPDRLTPDELAALGEVRTRAGERLARGDRVVVAALAGGTGSGKSSLFNALAGRALAEVGARRPVTSEPTGLAVGAAEDAGAVLDWLRVGERAAVPPDGRLPEGLVLVDLPDHDSVAVSHRDVVDRFVDRVDVLVWVVDPLKYAQRALHETYLRELAAHADVLLVVLNRSDELAPADLATVTADLRGLLDAEGLATARVLATSAVTGDGVDALLDELRTEVSARHAIASRIAADVVTVARDVGARVDPPPSEPASSSPALLRAMAAAVGVAGVAEDGERAYLQDARAGTRPLLSGVLLGLLARVIRPLRRWRTERARRRAVELRGPAGELPVGVRHALLELVDAATADADTRWRPPLRALAEERGTALATALASDLGRLELTPRPRRWWTAVSVLWTLVETVLLVGAGWLFASGVLVWLQLPPLPSPDVVGAVGLPTALLLGGLAAWLLLGAVRTRAVRRGARRHRRRLDAAVTTALRDRATTLVLAPLRAETAAIRELSEALATAAR